MTRLPPPRFIILKVEPGHCPLHEVVETDGAGPPAAVPVCTNPADCQRRECVETRS